MPKIILFILICFAYPGFAQNFQNNPFLDDANGRPLYWGASYVADGSPYFYHEYIPAEIFLANGRSYKDVKVKYNILEHFVQYQLDDGTEMMTISPVSKIIFSAVPTDDGILAGLTLESHNGLLNVKNSDVYQVLDSGRISCLKKLTVTYRDDQRYGEASITRHFERKETDFIRTANGQYQKAEKSRSFITGLMTDKKTEIDQYIEKYNINCNNMMGILAVSRYYNSLF